MSSQKKARGLPGMKEGPLVQMLDRQRVQQAAADEAKKLVDAADLAAERLVDATKEAEEASIAAVAAAHDPCAGFVHRARRSSEASFQLCQGCETEPAS
jgi:hypothetical protein